MKVCMREVRWQRLIKRGLAHSTLTYGCFRTGSNFHNISFCLQLECAVRCRRFSHCAAFTFDRESRTCSLFPVQKPQASTGQSKTVYWNTGQWCCLSDTSSASCRLHSCPSVWSSCASDTRPLWFMSPLSKALSPDSPALWLSLNSLAPPTPTHANIISLTF